jgi:hypothetical protein
MAGQADTRPPERVDHRQQIRNEFRDGVRMNRRRFRAQIVSALIRDDDAEASLCERPGLLSPSVPKLRESVQQNHRHSALRTFRHGMQANSTISEPEVHTLLMAEAAALDPQCIMKGGKVNP